MCVIAATPYKPKHLEVKVQLLTNELDFSDTEEGLLRQVRQFMPDDTSEAEIESLHARMVAYKNLNRAL